MNTHLYTYTKQLTDENHRFCFVDAKGYFTDDRAAYEFQARTNAMNDAGRNTFRIVEIRKTNG